MNKQPGVWRRSLHRLYEAWKRLVDAEERHWEAAVHPGSQPETPAGPCEPAESAPSLTELVRQRQRGKGPGGSAPAP